MLNSEKSYSTNNWNNINAIQNGVTNDLVWGDIEGEFDVIVTDGNDNRLSNNGIFFVGSCEPNHTYYETNASFLR